MLCSHQEGGKHGIEHKEDGIDTKEEKDGPWEEEEESYVQGIHSDFPHPCGEEWVTRFDTK
jgi:hypothetical protein